TTWAGQRGSRRGPTRMGPWSRPMASRAAWAQARPTRNSRRRWGTALYTSLPSLGWAGSGSGPSRRATTPVTSGPKRRAITPVPAPDETAHYVKALAAGNGDLYLADAPPPSAIQGRDTESMEKRWQERTARLVDVPARLDPRGLPCSAFQPRRSAGCLLHEP